MESFKSSRGEKVRRFFTVVSLAGVLLFTPGCMTYRTVDAIKHPKSTPLPDVVDRVERAFINTNGDLLICIEGRMGGATNEARYTLIVPLSKTTLDHKLHADDLTNRVRSDGCDVKRTNIISGWQIASDTNGMPVSIGASLAAADTSAQRIEQIRALTVTGRQLFPTPSKYDVFSGAHKTRFVYVDANYPETMTEIYLMPEYKMHGTLGYYFLLPFAVVGDIPLLPIEFIGLLILVHQVR